MTSAANWAEEYVQKTCDDILRQLSHGKVPLEELDKSLGNLRQEQDLLDYWSEVADTPWFQQHPLLQQENELRFRIPLRLYGDGAESHRHQYFECFALLAPLGASSTMESRFLHLGWIYWNSCYRTRIHIYIYI
ncbi:unnamed protein product [Symbiodinium microadriaticum]|nr:unnamed protein product [Symbiodinium microadriaticum]